MGSGGAARGDARREDHVAAEEVVALADRLAGVEPDPHANGLLRVRLGRRREEMTPAIPAPGRLPIDKPEVGLVDQRRGLEGLPRILPGQPLLREPPKLLVDMAASGKTFQ